MTFNSITPSPKTNIDPHGLIIGQGDFQYRVNSHWGRLDAEKYPIENCHGLDIDSKGNIYMISDHGSNNIIVYNPDGKLIDIWGGQFPGGHAIKIINENGEDFIYVVDCGWIVDRHWDGKSRDNKMQAAHSGFIAKLTIDGRLIFTIGHPQVVDAYQANQPFRPTDIAIANNGDIYITDGYGSDYVLQYDSQGRYIRHWGGHDNVNPQLNLANTHGIGIDYLNNTPQLIISSRADNALKRYSLDGKFLSTIETPGAYIGGPIFHGEHYFAPVCWSHIEGNNADDSGFISVFDKHDNVVANLGGKAPIYIEGELQTMTTTWNVFNHCHGLCIDEDGNIYLGQWNANQTYPFKLEKI